MIYNVTSLVVTKYVTHSDVIAGEYEQNLCSPTNQSCVPCRERLPSCRCLPDGPNPYPHGSWTARYVTCHDNRTVAMTTCARGYFNPRTGSCREVIEPGKFDNYGALGRTCTKSNYYLHLRALMKSLFRLTEILFHAYGIQFLIFMSVAYSLRSKRPCNGFRSSSIHFKRRKSMHIVT